MSTPGGAAEIKGANLTADLMINGSNIAARALVKRILTPPSVDITAGYNVGQTAFLLPGRYKRVAKGYLRIDAKQKVRIISSPTKLIDSPLPHHHTVDRSYHVHLSENNLTDDVFVKYDDLENNE